VRVPVTSLQRCGMDIWHSLQQSAVDSAIDGERVFAPVYRPKENILSSDNMLFEWAVIETVKRYSQFVECVFHRLTIHKVIIKVRHSCVIKNW